ncbi:MAG TPA: acyl-CoA carboxylase subunit epsilon [Cellulomonas sp.]
MTERSVSAPLAHVQVVRGTPDDVELAALVAGIVAAVGQDDDPDAAPAGADPDGGRPAWSDPARTVGRTDGTWRTGPDAWRWSLRA